MAWLRDLRARIALVGAVALVGAAAAVVPATLAAGDVGTGGGPFGTAGILRLHLNSDADYFRYDPISGSSTTSTITTSSSCNASVASGLVSVTVAPSTAVLGNADDSLGAKANGEGNGQKCGQVNGSTQSVTITLAGALADKSIDRAELDIGFKYDVIVAAELRSNGALVDTETIAGHGSDSGSDAGASDNARWEIGDGSFLFDQITLKLASNSPNKGAFGLEGGHDGTPAGPIGALLNTNDSIFRINDADGVLDCGDTATENGSAGEPDVTVQRLNNDSCQKIPYILDTSVDADSQDVRFEKDLTNQPDASFFLTADWANEYAEYPLPAIQVDEGSGFYTPEWCDGTFASPALPANYAHHWCVRKESTESAGTESVHRTTYFYGTGDPIFKLPTLSG